jgi:hypothetical protein
MKAAHRYRTVFILVLALSVAG